MFRPDLGDGDYQVLNVGDHTVVRNGSEPRLGKNADVWDCQLGAYPGQIVISQTYGGWHELCVCYAGGWNILDRDVTQLPQEHAGESAAESFVTARMRSRENNRYGYLLFSAVHEDGTIPEAPSNLGAFGARFISRLERRGVVAQKDMLMLQMFVPSGAKLGAAELRKVQSDFVDVRTAISDRLAGQGAE